MVNAKSIGDIVIAIHNNTYSPPGLAASPDKTLYAFNSKDYPNPSGLSNVPGLNDLYQSSIGKLDTPAFDKLDEKHQQFESAR